MRMFKKLARNSKGVTAIEYGLIAALVSVAAISAFHTVGQNLNTVMGNVGTSLATAG